MPKTSEKRLHEARQVCRQLIQAGYEAMLAGGCVRDHLLNRQPKDYDIATTALPDTVINLLSGEYKMVPTGMSHGTVTAVTSIQHIEITTLRRDVICDGRRAEVEFGGDFEQDARRRDFTVNALFEDCGGQVVDYVGGIQDAKEKRLKFVGEASQRIEEDALRSLRYFRLLSELGWQVHAAEVDEITRQANRADHLSKERVLSEIGRMLAAESALHIWPVFISAGLMQATLGCFRGDGQRLTSVLSAMSAEPDSESLELLRWWCFFMASLGWSQSWLELKELLSHLPISRRRKSLLSSLTQLMDPQSPTRLVVISALKLASLLRLKQQSLLVRVLPSVNAGVTRWTELLEYREGMPSLGLVLNRYEVSARSHVQLICRASFSLGIWNKLNELRSFLSDADHLSQFFLQMGWAGQDVERILLRTKRDLRT